MSTTNESLHDTHLYDPERHDNQIVALFHDREAAERARDALIAAGVAHDKVDVMDQPASQSATSDAGDSVGDQVLSAFMGLFSSEHDRDYAHAMQHGHAMVVVTPTGEGVDRHRVIEALEASSPIDFDAKLEEWRQAGYAPDGAPATASDGRRPGRQDPTATTSRVRSYLAERP